MKTITVNMINLPMALLMAALSLQILPSSINNSVAEAINVTPVTTTAVQIVNRLGLGSGSVLQVHCKDKNNDLGVHQIPRDQTYEFDFFPSFFGVTLYFCSFAWDNHLHRFDIYVEGRDRHACTDLVCLWEVFDDGPCLNSSSGAVCYGWN